MLCDLPGLLHRSSFLVDTLPSNQVCWPLVAIHSDVFAALWAQDVVTLGKEAPPHQGHRALLAVEAVVVPLPLLKGDVLTATET